MKDEIKTGIITSLITAIVCYAFMRFKCMGFVLRNGLKGLLIFLLTLYIASLIQTIIHEAGHLIFGLACNYDFLSFRLGNVIIIKEKGEIKIKRFELAKMAGQCLMNPSLDDNLLECCLYNLGGVFCNIISSLIFIMLALMLKKQEVVSFVFITLAFSGVLLALFNGIPLNNGMINNDGSNVMWLLKYPNCVKALNNQLRINNLNCQGVELKDIDEDLFYQKRHNDPDCSLITSWDYFWACRLLNEMKFEEASAFIKETLAQETSLIELHKRLMINDLMYCELLKGNLDITLEYLTKEQLKFQQSMKTYLAIIRTEYALARAQKDENKQQECLQRFEKACQKWPYQIEIDFERKLIDLVNKSENK